MFMLFTYNPFSNHGGWNHFAGHYATVEEAREEGVRQICAAECEEAHIADAAAQVIVLQLIERDRCGTKVTIDEVWATRQIN